MLAAGETILKPLGSSALMDRFIEHLDRDTLAGYLETDRPGNVKFYQKFGFEVQHEQPGRPVNLDFHGFSM